jgi:hypothetical protein
MGRWGGDLLKCTKGIGVDNARYEMVLSHGVNTVGKLSDYGADAWGAEIHDTNAFKQTVCITKVIEHIISESLNGLSAGMIYDHRPPGDSPELMPLDSVLFADVHY